MTIRLGRRGYQLLKAVHLAFCGIWLGSGVCLLVVGAMVPHTGDVAAMVETLQRVDLWVTVPCAVGSLLTGVLFSLTTPWGFVRHRWVVGKYLVNLVPVSAGAFLMAPWLVGMLEAAGTLGAAAPRDPTFQAQAASFERFVAGQLALLLVAVWLSVFKPALGQRRAGPAGP